VDAEMMGTLRFAHPTSSASALGCGIHLALENLRFQKTFKSRAQQATQGFRSGTTYPVHRG
jgi:hypothetical protein